MSNIWQVLFMQRYRFHIGSATNHWMCRWKVNRVSGKIYQWILQLAYPPVGSGDAILLSFQPIPWAEFVFDFQIQKIYTTLFLQKFCLTPHNFVDQWWYQCFGLWLLVSVGHLCILPGHFRKKKTYESQIWSLCIANLRFIGKSSWILTNYTWLERGDSQHLNGSLFVKIG